MKSKDEVLERLSLAHRLEMTRETQREIWQQIEERMYRGDAPRHRRQGRNRLIAGVAAVAGLAIAGVGVYAGTNVLTHDWGLASSQTPMVVPTGITYEAPKSIQAVTMANEMGLEYQPSNPAAVNTKVQGWLQDATAVTPDVPSTGIVDMEHSTMMLNQLTFVNQDGQKVVVQPAFYSWELTGWHDPHLPSYSNHLLDGIVSYRIDGKTAYLKCPEMDQWLLGSSWEDEFEPIAYTATEQKAVHAIKAVLKSTWGDGFAGMFMDVPGVASHDIFPGGPSSNGMDAGIPGTFETQADVEGNNVRVTFIESWGTGNESQHSWTFVVASDGAIKSHSESGVVPPQFRK